MKWAFIELISQLIGYKLYTIIYQIINRVALAINMKIVEMCSLGAFDGGTRSEVRLGNIELYTFPKNFKSFEISLW